MNSDRLTQKEANELVLNYFLRGTDVVDAEIIRENDKCFISYYILERGENTQYLFPIFDFRKILAKALKFKGIENIYVKSYRNANHTYYRLCNDYAEKRGR